MPLDQFLDVIYYTMLQNLDYDQEGRRPEDIRRSFDNDLEVAQWRTPFTAEPDTDDRPEGAPSWWVSDEEASGSFLASMGVQL